MIDFYIFCKRTGLQKFAGANCDQIGPFVETLSSYKVGVRQENPVCQFDVTLAPFLDDVTL